MKLYFYEWGRMIRKPLVVLSVILLIVCNAVVSRPGDSEIFSLSQKKTLYANLSNLSQPEKLAYVTKKHNGLEEKRTVVMFGGEIESEKELCVFTGDIFCETELFEVVQRELDHAEHYEDFLDQIDDNARKMGEITIFSSGNPYDSKIIAQTPAAYAPLRGRTLKAEFSDGLTAALTNPLTAVFLWILAVIFGVGITSEDLEKETVGMIRSTKFGRSYLTTARLFVAFSFSVLISGLMLCVSLTVNGVQWGLGDLLRTLQSVPYFYKSTLSITVLGYLFFTWGLSCLSAFLASLLAMVLTGKLRQSVPVYVAAALIFGGEYALYLLIPINSYLNPLKYLNLAALGNHFKVISDFQTLNAFGEPVELLSSILIAGAVLLTVLLLAVYRQGNSVKAVSITLPRIFRFQGRGLFLQESYKLLLMNKSAIALLALGAIVLWSAVNYTPNYDIDDLQYRSYIQAVEGKTGQIALDYIAGEEAYYQSIRDTWNQAEEEYGKGEIDEETHFQIVTASQNALKNEGKFRSFRQEILSLREKGIDTILYKTGFRRLIGPTAHDSNSLLHLLALAFLAVTLSPIYAADHSSGASVLIRSTKNGRERLRVSKLLLASLLGVAVSLIVFVPVICNTLNAFGTWQISENVQLLLDFPIKLSILSYLLLLTGVRACAYCGAAIGFTAISSRSKTILSSLILCVLAAGGIALIEWVVL